MTAFKLALNKKTVLQKLALGAAHITAMNGNANYPEAARVPTDAQFLAMQDALQSASEAVAAAENAWKAALATRAALEVDWDTMLKARASHCEAVTPQNLVALATTGLPLRGARSPIGDLPAPADLRVAMGAQVGTLDLRWDAVYGAGSYILESREYASAQPWQLVKILKQCRCTSTGHTSGKTYSFRVRALGTQGEGPWSDESVKMAP